MLTPKEKALDLYNKMVVDLTIDKWQSKQCALNTVDELISSHNKWDDNAQTNTEEYYYWSEVKQEIEKL